MESIAGAALPFVALGACCWLAAAHLVAFRRLRLGRYLVSAALWTLFAGLSLALMLRIHLSAARLMAVPPLMFLALMLSDRPVRGDYPDYASPFAVLLFARPGAPADRPAEPGAGLHVPAAAPPFHMPLGSKLLLAAVVLVLICLCAWSGRSYL